MKIKFWILYGLVLLATSFACKKTTKTQHQELPNIVLIISDDQSWTDYSFLGHRSIQTPFIDRLAETGLTFTRGYTTAPLCRPALASIATGLYPVQHKIIGNDPVFESKHKSYGLEWLLERKMVNDPLVEKFETLPTLPDLLSEAGYVSFQSGKWWEGSYEAGGFTDGMTHGNPARKGRHGDDGLSIGREGLEPLTDFINLADKEGKPFFVWYAPFLPHAPHTPPDSLKEKYMPWAPSAAVANYWAMCEWFDITCGQVEDYLTRKGIRENTIIVYVTDNGWIQDPDRPNRYGPRSKREPYEMGIRTPIIFNWPGVIEPEMDTSSMVSSIDIMTTILRVVGVSRTSDMQGIDVRDKQALAARDMIFAETYAHDFTGVDSSLYYRIALKPPWKLIMPDRRNKAGLLPELYNVLEDPDERINMASRYPNIVSDLTEHITRWHSKMVME
jgi:arylsulfatase A-like enzyme